MSSWYSCALNVSSEQILGGQVSNSTPPIRQLLDDHSPQNYTAFQVLEGTRLPQVELHAARLKIATRQLIRVSQHIRRFLITLECTTIVAVCAGDEVRFVGYNTQTKFPTPISVDTYVGPRTNPQVKCSSWSKIRRPIEAARRAGCTETLLIDGKRRVYEGSVSNVFFLRNDNVLVTAPDKLVLAGTMRDAVLQSARRLNIEVLFECVALDNIRQFRAAFVTNAVRRLHPIEVIWDGVNKLDLHGDTPFIDSLRQDVTESLISGATKLDG